MFKLEAWWIFRPWLWLARRGLVKMPDVTLGFGPSGAPTQPIAAAMWFKGPKANGAYVRIWSVNFTLEQIKITHEILGQLIDRMETFRKD